MGKAWWISAEGVGRVWQSVHITAAQGADQEVPRPLKRTPPDEAQTFRAGASKGYGALKP